MRPIDQAHGFATLAAGGVERDPYFVARVTDNEGEDDLTPAWSPDGTRLVYYRELNDRNYDIFTVNVDGSGETNLTNTEGFFEFDPDWAPNGLKIAFEGTGFIPEPPTLPQPQIFTMDPDGSDKVSVTLLGFNFDPVFSPDSSKIVFSSVRDAQTLGSDIYVTNADGSGQTMLTNTVIVFETSPHWSADGSMIVYVLDPDNPGFSGTADIYVMQANGAGPTQLTDSPAFDAGPTWR